MSDKVLVTYASRNGATAGVAEAVGRTLVESGLEVEVRPMTEVGDLTPYQSVVVGSAIREGAWLPEAMQFIRTHRAELARKPTATFQVCMTLAMKKQDAKTLDAVKTWVEPVRALVKPVSEGFFAGVLDVKRVPSLRQRLMFRISVLMGVWSEGDHRDWTAIRAWALSLPAKLQTTPQVTVPA